MMKNIGILCCLILTLCAGIKQSLAEEVRLNIKNLSHGDFNAIGELTLPENDGAAGQGKLVLITHGTLAHHAMEIIANAQALLEEEGIASLAISLSLGVNDRRGLYDCNQPHQHTHEDAQHEIAAWLDWLGSAYPQYDQVFMMGHSRGGNQTAQYLANFDHNQVKGGILLAPMIWEGQSAAQQQRLSKIKGNSPSDMQPVDQLLYCPDAVASALAIHSYNADDPNLDTPSLLNQVKKPVLVIAAADDNVVKQLENAVRTRTQNDLVEMVSIMDADHMFLDFYIEDAMVEAVEFISNH
ncbi:MAG: alpha/beta hydrolase family protein [Alphaproteobacteria bacterium]